MCSVGASLLVSPPELWEGLGLEIRFLLVVAHLYNL